jgi:hypothetical protein
VIVAPGLLVVHPEDVMVMVVPTRQLLNPPNQEFQELMAMVMPGDSPGVVVQVVGDHIAEVAEEEPEVPVQLVQQTGLEVLA